MRKFWLASVLFLACLAVLWVWTGSTDSGDSGAASGLAALSHSSGSAQQELSAAESAGPAPESTRRAQRSEPLPQQSLTGRPAPPRVVPRTFRFEGVHSKLSLIGRVEGSDGSPFADQELWLGVVPTATLAEVGDSYRSYDLSIETDTTGGFRSRLPPGVPSGSEVEIYVHHLTVDGPNQAYSAAGRFHGTFLVGGHDLELGTVQLIESDPLVAGVCRSRAGEALAGVHVSAACLGSGTAAVTDENGRFELSSRMPVETYLNVGGPSVLELADPLAVRCGDQHVELVVSVLGSVVGTFQLWEDEDPRSWEHQLLWCLPEELAVTGELERFPGPTVRSDLLGRFRFEQVQPGHYAYALKSPYGFRCEVGDFQVFADAENSPNVLQQVDPKLLFRSLDLEVRSPDGERIEKAALSIRLSELRREQVEFDGRLTNFLVPSAFEGQSTIQAPGYEPQVFRGWPEGPVILEPRKKTL